MRISSKAASQEARHGPRPQFPTTDGRLRSDSLSHADVYSGLHAAIAVLAALHHRDRTGEGQYIDVAMAAVMLAINERVHADLSGIGLGAEPPILGATDCAFFTGPGGETFVSPMSLVSTMSFTFYMAAMHRPDLVDDPRFCTAQDRKQNLAALHAVVQEWILTFDDMASLDAQFDEAKIPTGRVRTTENLVAGEWAEQWMATRVVPDRSGGEITLPGFPWHFSSKTAEVEAEERDTSQAPVDWRIPAFQGEHNEDVLRELGYPDDEITALRRSGALIRPGLENYADVSTEGA